LCLLPDIDDERFASVRIHADDIGKTVFQAEFPFLEENFLRDISEPSGI